MKFTDSQKLACDISRNIAVTAGAGSGKTSVLVERYLWCLENNNYQVRRVVAITFTEKAAGEMLGRIRERVLKHLSSELRDSARWEEVLEKLPLAPISTIHGFCQRLLREFPIEAGVDPNFEVYDEALKRIRLIHLIDDSLQQESESENPQLRLLSELWASPMTLRTILLQLIETRDKSLSWAQSIQHEDVSTYLHKVRSLINDAHHQGIQHIASSQKWQKAIELIYSLIPPGDTGKLSNRCQSILEFDQEFREQKTLDEQLTTLGMIRKNCSLIGATKAWKEDNRNIRLREAFEVLKTLYAQHLPLYQLNEPLEQSGFHIQQALAKLFLSVYEVYQQDKSARQLLDFDDLQERALLLLNNPAIHPLLARRYDYIMVDEFQDTNQLQWSIIKKLGTTQHGFANDKFCVVGDEKQSIYMFRGAEVAVFGEVREELQQTNIKANLLTVPLKIPPRGDPPNVRQDQLTGELIMAENFRSDKELIFFFNYLFSRLFLSPSEASRPYDVRHQELVAGKQEKNDAQAVKEQWDTEDIHPVEFLVADEKTEEHTNGSELEEPELIALRILKMVKEQPAAEGEEPGFRRNFRDIAILLRTRTKLKEFEEALRRYHIPFVVAGGIGFYQQQEIYDLANLLRCLVDRRQDIALAGVLRSPLFSFSDDQLLYLATESSPQRISDTTAIKTWTLWEKLRHHAGIVDLIPQELEPSKYLHAYTTLSAWKAEADRIPITHLLQRILDDTGLYGVLTADRRDVQAVTNIEKLLELARRFESEGFQSLSDFAAYLDQLIEVEEREGEAQLHTEGMNVVQLMTIHAAKGLEFPVVFVPELNRPFNYGYGESIYIDAISRTTDSVEIAAGIKGLDPEQNFAPENTILRDYLKRQNEAKTDAEMKRLLYVACTRAREQLLLSGTFSEKIPQNSWLSWLVDIFPLQDSLFGRDFMITETSEQTAETSELHIPVHTLIEYQKEKPLNGRHGESHKPESAAPEPPVSEEISHIAQILQINLRPIAGTTNERFQLNPSTLHLLFQCPRRYYYQHVLQFDEPILRQLLLKPEKPEFPPKDEQEQPTFGTWRGKIIHEIFEKQIFDYDWSEQKRADAITDLLKLMNVSSKKRKMMHLETAIQNAYKNYLAVGLKELLANSPEVHREYEFLLKTGRADISGIFDVLFLDPTDNIWTILDYKTNDIEAHQIEEIIRQHGYDVQMQIYALAVSRLLQTEQVKCILFFTAPGYRHEQFDLSPGSLKQIEMTLHSYLEKLSTDIIEAFPNQQICENCDYRQTGICSDSR